jgi:hypothetical protein
MSAAAVLLRVTLSRRTLTLVLAGVVAVGVGAVASQELTSGGGGSHRPDGGTAPTMTVPVPAVVGYPVVAAMRALTTQGFRVGVQPVHVTGYGVNPRRLPPVGSVLVQKPASLASVLKGSLVTLFVYGR